MPNRCAQKYNNLEDDLTHDHAKAHVNNQNIKKLMVIDDEESDKIDGNNLEDYPRGKTSLRKKKRKAMIMDDEDDNEPSGKEN